MRMHLRLSIICVAICWLGLAGAAMGETDIVVDLPELVLTRSGGNETCALPGTGYEQLVLTDEGATLVVTGHELAAGHKRVAGRGIRRISWEPLDGGTSVTIEYAQPPLFTATNAVAGTEYRQYTPQVVIGFGFDNSAAERRSSPLMGSRPSGRQAVEPDRYGSYELPEFPPVKYSDALVTLKVENVDFRDVLWLMSEIGGVSIILDPYWADEPTGGTRPPGGGADPGGGSGGGGPGFRPAGDFIPMVPRSGTGQLTLNFEDVPFDLALELILMSVGLYKIDIYPHSFD